MPYIKTEESTGSSFPFFFFLHLHWFVIRTVKREFIKILFCCGVNSGVSFLTSTVGGGVGSRSCAAPMARLYELMQNNDLETFGPFKLLSPHSKTRFPQTLGDVCSSSAFAMLLSWVSVNFGGFAKLHRTPMKGRVWLDDITSAVLTHVSSSQTCGFKSENWLRYNH